MPYVRKAAPRRRRVVLAKPGLDGHDRGIKVIGRALRDAGFEVVYTGLHQTPAQIVRVVVSEDPDVLGLSILSGAHVSLVTDIRELMRSAGVEDTVVVVGGTIPVDDIPALRALGVEAIFTPGANMRDVVRFFADAVRPSPSAGAPAHDRTAEQSGNAVGDLQQSRNRGHDPFFGESDGRTRHVDRRDRHAL